jgi:hypothetical protein
MYFKEGLSNKKRLTGKHMKTLLAIFKQMLAEKNIKPVGLANSSLEFRLYFFAKKNASFNQQVSLLNFFFRNFV